MLGGRKMIRMARKKAQVYDRSQVRPPSQFDSDTERFLLVLWRSTGQRWQPRGSS